MACVERFTLVELVETLNRILGSELTPRFDEQRKGDVKHSLADIEKARSPLLGYEPGYTFEKGLEETVEWYG